MKILRLGFYCFCFTSLLYAPVEATLESIDVLRADDDVVVRDREQKHVDHPFEIIGDTEEIRGISDDLLSPRKSVPLQTDRISPSIVLSEPATTSLTKQVDLSPSAKKAIKTLANEHPRATEDSALQLHTNLQHDRTVQALHRFYAVERTYTTYLQEMIEAVRTKKNAYAGNKKGFDLLLADLVRRRNHISDYLSNVRGRLAMGIIPSVEELAPIIDRLEKAINGDSLSSAVDVIGDDPGYFDDQKEGKRTARYQVVRFKNGLIQIGRTPIHN